MKKQILAAGPRPPPPIMYLEMTKLKLKTIKNIIMPNLVYNTIKISGRKECVDKVMNRILVTKSYIKEIEERNKGLDEDFQISTPAVGKLSFNRLIPKPTNIYCGELTNGGRILLKFI